jgi:signal transduction histidine kinase
VKYGAGAPIRVGLRADGGVAVIEVSDRGIGIAPEHQDRIFERFERAVSSRNYAGLGLGLWIVRRIVEAHGGAIRVRSTPGEGSTFSVELPLAGG